MQNIYLKSFVFNLPFIQNVSLVEVKSCIFITSNLSRVRMIVKSDLLIKYHSSKSILQLFDIIIPCPNSIRLSSRARCRSLSIHQVNTKLSSRLPLRSSRYASLTIGESIRIFGGSRGARKRARNFSPRENSNGFSAAAPLYAAVRNF